MMDRLSIDPGLASLQDQPISLASRLEDFEEAKARSPPLKAREVNIIANFVGEEVLNDLMDQLVDEICDDEELERQRDFLVKNLVDVFKVNLETDELFIALDNLENDNPNTLGILSSDRRKDSPDYAKHSKKRGRRSLAELRSKDGDAKGQAKISTHFNAREGKFLSKEP